MAAGIGAGDSVLVPNYTMIATVNSVRFVGATPIIIDVDATSYTLSLEALTAARLPTTKAVLHVSLNNRHAGIKDIAEYCKTNGLVLLEDAAQSLGCTVDGVHFGRYGDIGCFSLSTPKIISTGQGGFLITDNDEYARKINMIKNFGRRCGGVDDFEVFGINAKFTDLQAVVGIEQMKKLPARVPRLRAIFDAYYSELSPLMRAAPFESWIPWFVDIFVERRDDLVEYLKKHNVQTRPTYPMISSTPMYETQAQYPISKYVSEHGLFLPTHTHLKDEEIRHICGLILLFFSA
jgi:perosamine synthetase